MYRIHLFMFVFTVGLINAMIRPILEHINEYGIRESLFGGFGISFIVWFALYCSFNLLHQSTSSQINKRDIVISLIALLLLCIPSALLSWVTLSIFAGYCSFFATALHTKLRNACLIMMAIALRVPLSDLCLKLSADAFLQFDAIATLTIVKTINPEITRQGNILIGSSGHELLIMTGCSSFTNVSLALLLWFAIVRTQILVWNQNFNLYILPLCILIMSVNIFRLSMMTLSVDLYYFYHDGLGADITNTAILLIALLTALTAIHINKTSKKRTQHVS